MAFADYVKQNAADDKMANYRRAMLITAALICCAASVSGADQTQVGGVRLNHAGFEYAQALIKSGHFVADGKGAWISHHSAKEQENEFIRLHGFAEYAKWHLGLDERHAGTSKARYKFPYGDFESVHRCGLLAAKNRARQYGYAEIESAASELIEMINSKSPRR